MGVYTFTCVCGSVKYSINHIHEVNAESYPSKCVIAIRYLMVKNQLSQLPLIKHKMGQHMPYDI